MIHGLQLQLVEPLNVPVDGSAADAVVRMLPGNAGVTTLSRHNCSLNACPPETTGNADR